MKVKLPYCLFILLLCVLNFSCKTVKQAAQSSNQVKRTYLDNNTYKLTEMSTDTTYGFSEQNPIKVGGVDKSEGPTNERRFLNALTGVNGEPISYKRQGSCCLFKTKNGLLNESGLLDKYKVYQIGGQDTIVLYLNMYDYDILKIPVGFKAKQ